METVRLRWAAGIGLGLLLTATVGTAAASDVPRFGSVDVHYTASAKLDVAPDDDSGNGFGARLMAPVTDDVLVTAEYGSSNYDDTDIDLDQLRFGLAGMGGDRLRGGLGAEFVKLEFEFDFFGSTQKLKQEGLHAYGRIEYDVNSRLSLYGQAGYQWLTRADADLTGPEYLAGAVIGLGTSVGAFAEYRYSDLEDRNGDSLQLRDFHLGLRFVFGN